jgi:hypothetical protein
MNRHWLLGKVAPVTVTVAEPTLPSLVAVIVAEPGATAVTTPWVETLAIAGADEAQLVVLSFNVPPDASLAVAVRAPV